MNYTCFDFFRTEPRNAAQTVRGCIAHPRRPDSEKPEIFTEKDLDDLRYNLAHLSVDAVRRFYERAYEDCRMIYDRLPAPKQIQTRSSTETQQSAPNPKTN